MPREQAAEVGSAAFVKRTAERLAGERAGDAGPAKQQRQQPAPAGDPPASRTPPQGAETDEHELGDQLEGGGQDDLSQEDWSDPDDDGTPDYDDPDGDDDDPDNTDWEKRYKDTQAELTRLQQAQSSIDQERAEESSRFLETQFELEDSIRQVRQQAEFLRTAMTGNAQRFQNINWAQVPADQLPQVQEQARQAFAMAQQAEQAYQQHIQQAEHAEAQMRQRQARIAHARLSRTIPGWRENRQEVLKDLREFALSSGMAADSFAQLLDPVVIEWAYKARMMDKGQQTVKRERRNRDQQRPPRHRGAQQQPRSVDGKFRKASKEFEQRPGRDTFRAKAEARLHRERR